MCWEISPAAEAAARGLDQLRAETLYYAAREAARNAARHGRGGDQGRALTLRVAAACGAGAGGAPAVEVLVEDDGVGSAPARPGGGAGAGLALHGTIVAILGGALVVQSPVGGPTRVTISLPVESATN
jgi:signal transduction histidine kinase